MNSERDANRIVRSWLEAGSNAIPDRVLDAVLSELPSTPQRRSQWSSWRSQKLNAFIKIAAVAAVVLIAVVAGTRFLPGDAIVGVPAATSSPVPSPSQTAIGGHFIFAGDAPVDITGSSDGSSLSGTATGSWAGKPFSIRLECLRQFDGQTWMLAGVLTQSATADRNEGDWGAVIVRDGSPQQAGVWTSLSSVADDCEGFVSGIPDMAVEGQDMIGPMDQGGITLPPGSSTGTPISGQFTFDADREITVSMDGVADGSILGRTVAGSPVTGLSGSAVITYVGEGEFTVGLRCARQFDDQTWFLAGVVEESSGTDVPVGQWQAVTVRDTSPQQVNIFGAAEGAWDDCLQFLRSVSDAAVEGQDMIGPVKEGGITLPASLE